MLRNAIGTEGERAHGGPGRGEIGERASARARGREAWGRGRGGAVGGKVGRGREEKEKRRREPRGRSWRRDREVDVSALDLRGWGEGTEGAAFWKVEPGAARADSPLAFNFPCFLGILILFSGKLPVP